MQSEWLAKTLAALENLESTQEEQLDARIDVGGAAGHIGHDDAHGLLRPGGLRLRREGRRWIQTLKGEGETVGGLSSRPELEWPLKGPEPDYALVRSSSLGKLFKRKLCRELAPAFETDMRRSAVELLLPGGSWAEAARQRATGTRQTRRRASDRQRSCMTRF